MIPGFDDVGDELSAEGYILRNMPERYGAIATQIELCLDYSAMVPSKLCLCDGEGPHCDAHRAAHGDEMKGQADRLERFCRLVERWRSA